MPSLAPGNRWARAVPFVLLFVSTESVFADATIYAVNDTGQFMTIDATTGAGTLVGSIDYGVVEALELGMDGNLLAIVNFDDLISIDPKDASSAFIGDVPGFGRVEGLAWNPRQTTLFGSANDTSSPLAEFLITIDPSTPDASLVGSFGTGDMEALAMSDAGQLFGANLVPSLFVEIDTKTGLASTIAELEVLVAALDFAPDGTLYGATLASTEGGPSSLITINPADGSVTEIGPIGFDFVTGLVVVSDVAECPWDLNHDGNVGAADLLTLLVSWGPCRGCPADFDGNGTVGATDLLALLVNWGPCP